MADDAAESSHPDAEVDLAVRVVRTDSVFAGCAESVLDAADGDEFADFVPPFGRAPLVPLSLRFFLRNIVIRVSLPPAGLSSSRTKSNDISK